MARRPTAGRGQPFELRKLNGGAALIALLLVGLSLAEGASAGTYKALACDQAVGGRLATASFETNSEAHWSAVDRCADGGELGLAVRYGGAPYGTLGRWRIAAPAGLRFHGGWIQAFLDRAEPYQARYLYRVPDQPEPTLVGRIDQNGWWEWPNPGAGKLAADQLVIELQCVTSSGCPPAACPRAGPGDCWPILLARNLGFWVEDFAPPQIAAPAGALMEGPAQRGTQLLELAASDQGGGVSGFELHVNGERFAVEQASCAVGTDAHGPYALGLVPCPPNADTHFAVDTTSAPFGEGKNAIEVCATDYADDAKDPETWPEQSCSPAPVYVDNSCDLSQAPDAADIRFGFGKRARARLTVRYGKRARAVAKLTDAADEPIEHATVCVSTKDRIDGAGEIDIAEAQTNERGKAKVKLPKGASRRVKLTYWADEERVEMRTVRLNVRARPKLQVLSKRRLSDGAKARFRVKLAGPYRGHRKVAVQALAPAGWLDFPGCVGKTNRTGIFRCSYRFREQLGPVNYKFRALAPRQPGYPYLQGRTGSAKVLVRD